MKNVLDHVDNMVLLCDTSHENNVRYMNKTAKRVFEKYKTEIQQVLRGADPTLYLPFSPGPGTGAANFTKAGNWRS